MLDNCSLLDNYSKASVEVRQCVKLLNQYKSQQHVPDFDQTVIQKIYNDYLKKKKILDHIDSVYQKNLQKHGLSV